ncbi:unnamed protein product [Didymodactylos carnosus]|uniref:Uncharacterized protein n=1 Tax=Didymodactylos carnosus TaxID=1234261 RepID=A0A815TD88_9BILA|nr:unnamed protein product [Didymodactylos carnosus]CAF4363074.1 unnamed protein product [Didymodactylos carnosus]
MLGISEFSSHPGYQFYIDDNKTRQIELDLALEKNILNNEIDCIHLLLEKKEHIPCHLSNKYDKCIYVWLLGKRLKFNVALEFSQNRLRGLLVAVINSDIYFDKTIRLLKIISEMKNKLIALSVIEANNDGRTRDIRCSQQYVGSHDTYIFKPPIKNFQEVYNETNIYVGGLTGGENRIMFELENKSGIISYNPCKLIKAYHLHESNVRHGNRTNRVDSNKRAAYALPTDKLP